MDIDIKALTSQPELSSGIGGDSLDKVSNIVNGIKELVSQYQNIHKPVAQAQTGGGIKEKLLPALQLMEAGGMGDTPVLDVVKELGITVSALKNILSGV